MNAPSDEQLAQALRDLPGSLDLHPRPGLAGAVATRARQARRRNAALTCAAGLAVAVPAAVVAPRLLESGRDGDAVVAAVPTPAPGPSGLPPVPTLGPTASEPAQRERTLSAQEWQAALDRMRAGAAATPWQPDRVRYTRTDSRHPSGSVDSEGRETTWYQRSISELWIARDGAARIRNAQGEPEFASEADRRRHERSGGNLAPRQFEETLPARSDRLLGWSSAKPDALLERIRRTVGEGDIGVDEGSFRFLPDTLRAAVVTPDLQVALYDAISRVDGVRVLQGVRTPSGRPALALAKEFRGSRTDVLVDPSTGAYLGDRMLAAATPTPVPTGGVQNLGLPIGTVISESEVVSSAWVDRLGQRPAGAPVPRL